MNIFSPLLATAASLILLYEFLRWIVLIAIFAIGCYILWDNLRELWHD